MHFATKMLATGLLLILVLALPVSSQSPPPSALHDGAEIFTPGWKDGPEGMDGGVTWSTLGKRLSVEWWALIDGVPLSARQELAVSYWPTAVGVTPNFGELYVAGLSSRGFPKIDRIQLRSPAVLYGVEPGSGAISATIVPAGVDSITEVYFNDLPEEGMISSLVVKVENPDLILVHFYGSKSLFELDAPLPSLVKVATMQEDGDPSTMTVSSLNRVFDVAYARKHNLYGNVYWLSSASGDPPTVVLTDPDEDGELDSVLLPYTAADVVLMLLDGGWQD